MPGPLLQSVLPFTGPYIANLSFSGVGFNRWNHREQQWRSESNMSRSMKWLLVAGCLASSCHIAQSTFLVHFDSANTLSQSQEGSISLEQFQAQSVIGPAKHLGSHDLGILGHVTLQGDSSCCCQVVSILKEYAYPSFHKNNSVQFKLFFFRRLGFLLFKVSFFKTNFHGLNKSRPIAHHHGSLCKVPPL